MALPGPFLPGQRLTAGQLNDATQKTMASVDVNIEGVILDNVTTTETTITQLTLGPFDQRTGALYSVETRIIIQQTDASDEFLLIMRKNTPLTGTIIANWNMWRLIENGKGALFHAYADFPGTADESVTYYFSVIRRPASGTGHITIYGHHTSDTPTGAKILRTGYSSEYTVVIS
jgi:hypothetical protein